MIKNKKDIGGYYIPIEDYKEVYYAFHKQGYYVSINWCFVDMLLKNIKAPTFKNIHKLLERAIIKQLRRVCQ